MILLGIVDLVRFVFAAVTSASHRVEAKQCGSLIGPDRTHTNQLIKFVFHRYYMHDSMIDNGRISRSVQDTSNCGQITNVFGNRTDTVGGVAGDGSRRPINGTNIRSIENEMKPFISLQ